MMSNFIKLWFVAALTPFLLSRCSSEGFEKESSNLEVYKPEIEFDVSGGEKSVGVKCDIAEISIAHSEDWFTAELESTTAQRYNLKLNVQRNSSGESRVGSVLLKAGDSEQSVKILQSADTDPTTADFTMATYNIRLNLKEDADLGADWSVRKEPLANLVEARGWDIFGKQEGYPYQLEELMELLPAYDYINNMYGGPESKSGTASIIYKRDEFELLDQGVFWYSETPLIESIGWDATDTRLATWGKFKHLSSGKEFYFFTSHFFHKNVTARRNSGQVMVDQIQRIRTENLPVFSTGDFNSRPEDPQIDDILEYLNDAHEVTEEEPIGPYKTNVPKFFGNNGNPTSKIDYIMVNDQVEVLSYETLVDKLPNGLYISDHLPIEANVRLE